MKKLILIWSVLLVPFSFFAQCNIDVHFTQETVCPGEDLRFAGYSSGACDEAYAWIYTWQYNSDQILFTDTLYSIDDSSFVTMPPEVYNIVIDGVTLFLTVENSMEEEIGDDNYGHTLTAPLYPIRINYFGPLSICNSASNIGITGGTAPYMLEVNGTDMIPDEFWPEMYQPLDSGSYDVHVMDELGCILDTVITYVEYLADNYTCDAAKELQNQVPFYFQSVCSYVNTDLTCAGNLNWEGGWFSFNSENFQNLSLILVPESWGENISDVQYCYELFESVNGDCSNLSSVYCGCTLGGQFNLSDFFTLQQNTTYFLALKTTAFFSDIVIDLDDIYELNVGCSEPFACNYNPLPYEYEVCLYPGCTDVAACNYNALSICDDASCIYPHLTCQVFYDMNENGNWNTAGQWPEIVIGGVGYFTVQETGLIIYPDAEGRFNLYNLTPGNYTLYFTDETNYWQLSTSNSISFEYPSCETYNIGIIPENNSLYYKATINEIVIENVHCNNGSDPLFVLQNFGNQPLKGILTATYNPALTIGLNSNSIPYEQAETGTLIWNINQQSPGSIMNYGYHVFGQGISIGEEFEFYFLLTILDQEGIVIDTQEWTYTSIVTCDEIANIKQADPKGYLAEHFILPGEEIHYTIQFQNTGNNAVESLIISDLLDVTRLDLSTLEFTSSSHSFHTFLEPNGLINFVSDHIQLPAAAMDQPASHGFVSFRIRPLNNLSPDDVIYNQANITMDENSSVATNTTWHTIFDCDSIYHLPFAETICEGEFTAPEVDMTYVQNIEWFVDGNYAGDQSILNTTFESGNHQLQLFAGNELCTYESVMDIIVIPVPGSIIEWDETCLFAPDGVSFQWYLNDQLLPGEELQAHCPNPDVMYTGGYHCVITGANGCVTDTEFFFFVSTSENETGACRIFPNPVSFESTVMLPTGIWNVELLNSLGQIVESWPTKQSSFILHRNKFTAGQYVLVLKNQMGNLHSMKIIMD